MKKTLVMLLALVFVFASVAMAEQPEGYPEVVEGIDFGHHHLRLLDQPGPGRETG